MTIYAKESGNWRLVKEIQIKESGTWRELKESWVKENGEWKLNFPGRNGWRVVLGNDAGAPDWVGVTSQYWEDEGLGSPIGTVFPTETSRIENNERYASTGGAQNSEAYPWISMGVADDSLWLGNNSQYNNGRRFYFEIDLTNEFPREWLSLNVQSVQIRDLVNNNIIFDAPKALVLPNWLSGRQVWMTNIAPTLVTNRFYHIHFTVTP